MSRDDGFERAAASPELTELLRRSYGIARPETVRDLGGGYNLNLLVRDGPDELVVRVYNTWVPQERLTAIQQVREHLRACSLLPVAPLRRTLTGEGFSVLGTRLVEVERFLPVDAHMSTWPTLLVGLPVLGRLHNALGELMAPTAAAHAPWANHIPAARIVEETSPAIAALRELNLTSAQTRHVESAERLAAALLDAHRRAGVELPLQLVHGDYWDNNVGLSAANVVMIGDFDFMGARPRVDDLALTLFFTNEHFGRRDTSSERLARLRVLVDRYDVVLTRPLSLEERAALPFAIARSPLSFVRDIAYQGHAALDELTALRGPEWEWGLGVIESPQWLEAFLLS